MKDYIDILIESIQDLNPVFDTEYALQHNEELLAQDALLATLNDEQKRLYDICEDQQIKTASLYETILFCRIFFLAREIYC